MADEELSVREKVRRDRLARIQQDKNQGRVRVVPRDDDMRALLKHPLSNVGFLHTGSVEWPDDSFTRRRIEDGSVTLESEPAAKRGRGDPPPAAA